MDRPGSGSEWQVVRGKSAPADVPVDDLAEAIVTLVSQHPMVTIDTCKRKHCNIRGHNNQRPNLNCTFLHNGETVTEAVRGRARMIQAARASQASRPLPVATSLVATAPGAAPLASVSAPSNSRDQPLRPPVPTYAAATAPLSALPLPAAPPSSILKVDPSAVPVMAISSPLRPEFIPAKTDTGVSESAPPTRKFPSAYQNFYGLFRNLEQAAVEKDVLELRAVFPVPSANQRGRHCRDEDFVRLLKTMVAMYNTPQRDQSAYIVFGVGFQAGRVQFVGLKSEPDSAFIADAFSNFVCPPKWELYAYNWHGNMYAIIEVFPVSVEERQSGTAGPCMATVDMLPRIREKEVYYRNKSSNASATEHQRVDDIWAWFHGQPASPSVVIVVDSLQKVKARRGRTVLLASPLRTSLDVLASMSALRWHCVFDFDIDSDSVGLLSAWMQKKDSSSAQRVVPMLPSKPDASAAAPELLPWVHVIGQRRAGAHPQRYADWLRRTSSGVFDLVKGVAHTVSIAPVVAYILWDSTDPDLFLCLAKVIEQLISDAAFGENIEFVFVFSPEANLAARQKFDTVLAEMFPLEEKGDAEVTRHICQRLVLSPEAFGGAVQRHLALENVQQNLTHFWLPPEGTTFLTLSELHNVEADFEVLHCGTGKVRVSTDNYSGPPPYLLGGARLSWEDLHRADQNMPYAPVLLDIVDRVVRTVDSLFKGEQRTTVRDIAVLQTPGAGGTTAGRCILWKLHDRYQCLALKRIDNVQDLMTRVECVAKRKKDGLVHHAPLVILVEWDSFQATTLYQFYAALAAARLRVVFIRMIHILDWSARAETRQLEANKPQTGRKKEERRRKPRAPIVLQEPDAEEEIRWLSESDAYRFYTVFHPHVSADRRPLFERTYGTPERFIENYRKVNSLPDDGQRYLYIPFFFMLWAFEEKFVGITHYVKQVLRQCEGKQLRVLAAVAFFHHYGGVPFNSRLISRSEELQYYLPDQCIALLVDLEKNNRWQLRHPLLALELVKQLSVNATEPIEFEVKFQPEKLLVAEVPRKLNPYPLGVVSIKILKDAVLSGSSEVPTYVEDIFLEQDDFLEGKGIKFAAIIRDLTEPDARRTFQLLQKAFPSNRHVHAHFARYLAGGLRAPDFEAAEKCMASALEGAGQKDFKIRHVNAVVLREKSLWLLKEANLAQFATVSESLIVGQKATEEFESLCDPTLWPNAEWRVWAFNAWIQFLLRAISYINRHERFSVWLEKHSKFNCMFLERAFDQLEELLNDYPEEEQEQENFRYTSFRKELLGLRGDYREALRIRDADPRHEDFLGTVLLLLRLHDGSFRKMKCANPSEFKRCIEEITKGMTAAKRSLAYRDQLVTLWVRAIRYQSPAMRVDLMAQQLEQWYEQYRSDNAAWYLWILAVLDMLFSRKSRQECMKQIDRWQHLTMRFPRRHRYYEYAGLDTESMSVILLNAEDENLFPAGRKPAASWWVPFTSVKQVVASRELLRFVHDARAGACATVTNAQYDLKGEIAFQEYNGIYFVPRPKTPVDAHTFTTLQGEAGPYVSFLIAFDRSPQVAARVVHPIDNRVQLIAQIKTSAQQYDMLTQHERTIHWQNCEQLHGQYVGERQLRLIFSEPPKQAHVKALIAFEEILSQKQSFSSMQSATLHVLLDEMEKTFAPLSFSRAH